MKRYPVDESLFNKEDRGIRNLTSKVKDMSKWGNTARTVSHGSDQKL